jgi:hypothetical protein
MVQSGSTTRTKQMSHGPVIVLSGPQDPRAHEGIPVQPRRGDLDVPCPTCHGRGQYNVELHPHGRSKREVCADCRGDGWIETTGDATAVSDIVMVDGHPQWVTRYVTIDNSHLSPTAVRHFGDGAAGSPTGEDSSRNRPG